MFFHATRSSGSCSVISASHSCRDPPNSAVQCSCRSSSWRIWLDAVHELRELLELRPLVVDRSNRRLDIDRLLDRAHRAPFSRLQSPYWYGPYWSEDRARVRSRTVGVQVLVPGRLPRPRWFA